MSRLASDETSYYPIKIQLKLQKLNHVGDLETSQMINKLLRMTDNAD